MNVCFVSGWKNKTTKKKLFPLPSMLSYESLVSIKENTDRKRKKEKKYG